MNNTDSSEGRESAVTSNVLNSERQDVSAAPAFTPRHITDDDLVRVANENYQAGRKHGKEETLDERETLIYWLLRCYQSGHREGWEQGASTTETMSRVCDVLAERGYDPNLDTAAKELIARMEKR